MLDVLQMDEELSDQGMETELDPTQLLEVSICPDKGYQIVQQRMILVCARTGSQNPSQFFGYSIVFIKEITVVYMFCPTSFLPDPKNKNLNPFLSLPLHQQQKL
jgi:hypothetical protein